MKLWHLDRYTHREAPFFTLTFYAMFDKQAKTIPFTRTKFFDGAFLLLGAFSESAFFESAFLRAPFLRVPFLRHTPIFNFTVNWLGFKSYVQIELILYVKMFMTDPHHIAISEISYPTTFLS